MEKQFCPNCEKTGLAETVHKEEVIKVRDLDVRALNIISKCSMCGKTFATEVQEEENLRKAYDEYRHQKNLLSPEDIKQIRRNYGLSQANFSRWLGWGDITVHRYESGALQDTAHNEMLVLLKDPRNAKRVYESNKQNLDELAANRLGTTISKLLNTDTANLIESDLVMTLSDEPPSEFNGYRRFDIDRFENLVLYILGRVGPSFKTALNKFLWYIDFGFYRTQTVSITGAKYIKFPHGPIPKSYDYIFANMTEKGYLDVKEVISGKYVGEQYRRSIPANTDLFQGNELKTINQWILLLKGKTSRQLSDLAHNEKAYKFTEEKTPISYKYAKELKLRPRVV